MDIRGILSDKKFLNVAKEISFDELLTEPLNKDPSNTIIGYINQFSLYKKFKLIFKRYLIDFLNLFLKEKKIYQKSRSVEEVKLKYEKIAGSYIEEFYDHEKSEDGT